MGSCFSKQQCCDICDMVHGTGLGDKPGKCPQCRKMSMLYRRELEVHEDQPYWDTSIACDNCSFKSWERCEGRARVKWAIRTQA